MKNRNFAPSTANTKFVAYGNQRRADRRELAIVKVRKQNGRPLGDGSLVAVTVESVLDTHNGPRPYYHNYNPNECKHSVGTLGVLVNRSRFETIHSEWGYTENQRGFGLHVNNPKSGVLQCLVWVLFSDYQTPAQMLQALRTKTEKYLGVDVITKELSEYAAACFNDHLAVRQAEEAARQEALQWAEKWFVSNLKTIIKTVAEGDGVDDNVKFETWDYNRAIARAVARLAEFARVEGDAFRSQLDVDLAIQVIGWADFQTTTVKNGKPAIVKVHTVKSTLRPRSEDTQALWDIELDDIVFSTKQQTAQAGAPAAPAATDNQMAAALQTAKTKKAKV